MATWKFLNIGKANAEIERLEAELAAAKAAAPDPKSPPKPAEPGNVAALELKIEELSDTLSVLGDRIGALEKASSDTAAGFKVEIARLDKSFSDYQANAKELATRLAAEITGRQGQAPLKLPAAGAANGNGHADGIVAEWMAIKDPSLRTAFYRKNKDAIKAAQLAERAK